jgi:hypothetical protein
MSIWGGVYHWHDWWDGGDVVFAYIMRVHQASAAESKR